MSSTMSSYPSSTINAAGSMPREYLRSEDILPTDILLGCGPVCQHHIGTIAYKIVLNFSYAAIVNSNAKHELTVQMVDAIFKDGGRFLNETKPVTGFWYLVETKYLYKKVKASLHHASQQRKGGVLNKINFTATFSKTDSFGELIAKLSGDPEVDVFLKTQRTASSKSGKRLPPKSKSGKMPRQKAASLPRAEVKLQEGAPISSAMKSTRKQPQQHDNLSHFDDVSPYYHKQPMYLTNEDIRPTDVLLSGKRGSVSMARQHTGTVAFKTLIELKYNQQQCGIASRVPSSAINRVALVEEIFAEGGRFLRETTFGSGVWIELNRRGALEQVHKAIHQISLRRNQRMTNNLMNVAPPAVRKNNNNDVMAPGALSVPINERDGFMGIIQKLCQQVVVLSPSVAAAAQASATLYGASTGTTLKEPVENGVFANKRVQDLIQPIVPAAAAPGGAPAPPASLVPTDGKENNKKQQPSGRVLHAFELGPSIDIFC